MLRFKSFIYLFLCCQVPLFGVCKPFVSHVPQLDSVVVVDTTNYQEKEYKEVIYNAPVDSLTIESRNFDGNEIQKLKSDPNLNYKQSPTIAESLWDRLLM